MSVLIKEKKYNYDYDLHFLIYGRTKIKELGVEPILTQIRQCKEKWGEQLQRMEKHCLPRTA
jgi:hypothetical protein